MSCTTHHHACDCREQKVREMCEYLLAFDVVDGGYADFGLLDAATEIARDLYGEAQREDHHDA